MAAVVSDVLQTRMEVLGLGGYVGSMVQAATALGLMEAATDKATKRQLGFAVGAGAVALGIGGLLAKSVQAAGRMEQMSIAFTTLEGSAGAAQAQIEALQKFAASTPFDFEQSVKAAQQLRAMGIEAKDLIPTMTAVGNAVAAAGGGTDVFQGALRAIGQIQTKGRLSQEEINQLSERGIPAAKILQDELGLTAKQMLNIGDAGIPAEKAIAALLRGFNKKFGGAMEAQSKTLFGSFSNLTDATNQLAAAVGAPLAGPITEATKIVTGLVNAINAAPKPVKDLIAVVGVGVAGALAIYAVSTAIAIRNTARLTLETIALANAQLKLGNAVISKGKGGSFGTNLKLAGAALAVDLGLQAVNSGNQGKMPGGGDWGADLGRVGGRAAEGAWMGGAVGGTPGALIGAAARVFYGIWEDVQKINAPNGKKADDPVVEELKKANAELKKISGAELAFNTRDVSGAQQVAAMARAVI